MDVNKVAEKFEKYKKKKSNIEKIVDEILKEEKIEEHGKEIKEAILHDVEKFEVTPEFLNEYIQNQEEDEDEDKVLKKIDKNKKEFFKELIQKQVSMRKTVIETQEYYKNLEFEKKHLELEVQKLKEFKEKSEKNTQELIDMVDRYKKDYENLSKRTEKEKQQVKENASLEICKSIIEIMDNFELALNHIRATEEDKLEKQSVLSGLEKVEKKFNYILTKEGVNEINALNELFDHNIHEAIATEEREDLEQDDTVIEEFRKGYMFKDNILRPSLVKVGKKI